MKECENHSTKVVAEVIDKQQDRHTDRDPGIIFYNPQKYAESEQKKKRKGNVNINLYELEKYA